VSDFCLATIGSGWFAGTLTEAAKKVSGLTPVANWSPTPSSRDAFAAANGLRPAGSLGDLLTTPEIDAVLIATPHTTHDGLILAAVRAGKHVFVEKPMTLTSEGAGIVAAAAASTGAVVQVGHNRRRQPAMRALHELISTGAIGRILQADAYVSVPFRAEVPAWRLDPTESPAGGMTALGVHHVDTLTYLLGAPTRVMAMSVPGAARTALDEATAVLMEHETGAISTLGTSFFSTTDTTLRLHGDRGAAWSTDDGTRLFVQSSGRSPGEEIEVEVADTIVAELVDFERCLRTGELPETGTREGILVAEVLDAIKASVREGIAVDL
jgi:predicted dehydrogenase